jgi:putative SOS response-associated peptidase YedK
VLTGGRAICNFFVQDDPAKIKPDEWPLFAAYIAEISGGRVRLVRPTDAATFVARDGGRLLVLTGRFGLVPRWAKTIAAMASFNARGETVATTPLYRAAFRDRRCVVPFVEFVETRQSPRQMFRIRPAGFFGGVWDRATVDGATLDSFSIVTTTPSAQMAAVHQRMPLILRPQDCRRWIECDPAEAASLIRPYDGAIELVPAGGLKEIA